MNKYCRKLFCLALICSAGAGIANGQTTINTMSQVNNLIDDVVFRSLLEVDLQKAEAVNLSNKKCFIPTINYIDQKVFGKGNTIIIDGDKVKDFVVHMIKTGTTKKGLSKHILVSLKKGSFLTTEKTPSKISDEK